MKNLCHVQATEDGSELLVRNGTPWMFVLRASRSDVSACTQITRLRRRRDKIELTLLAAAVAFIFLVLPHVLDITAEPLWVQMLGPGVIIVLFFAGFYDSGRRFRVANEQLKPHMPRLPEGILPSSVAVPDADIPQGARFFLLPFGVQQVELLW